MSAVQLIVDSAESFLTNAARSTFLGLVEASGTLVGYMAVLAVALVGINMMLQLRPMTWGHALSLMIKLAMIGIFAWNWNQFWAVAGGILKAIEATAGGILASSGNGLSGPTITDGFASAIDQMMDKFTVAATNIAAEMCGLSTAVQNPATRRRKIRPGDDGRRHGARAYHRAGACHGALA
ncbi:type IV secretion system protein, partial [Paracoccus rhizosphaerae]